MSRTTRTARRLIGVCLALGMVCLGGAATAAADDADYLYDLSNAGIGGPPDQLLQVGRGTCGRPRDASIAEISQRTALAEGDAAFLYDSAVKFLCQ